MRTLRTPTPTLDSLALLRKRYFQIAAVANMVSVPMWAFVTIASAQDYTGIAAPLIAGLINIPAFGLVYYFARRDALITAGGLFYALTLTGMGLSTSPVSLLFYGTLTIVTAAVINSRELYLLGLLLVTGRGLFSIYEQVNAQIRFQDSDIGFYLVLVFTFIAVGIMLRYFFTTLTKIFTEQRRSASLLETTAEVNTVTMGMMHVPEMLQRSAEFVRDRFIYYYVQVFMLAPAGSLLELVAGTGERGRTLVEEGYVLTLNRANTVTAVFQRGDAIIATADDVSSFFQRRDVLPKTRSEAALPIRDAEQVIGVLNVQSMRDDAFQPNDLQALQITANLLGAAVRNARLFEETQRSVQENKRLFLEAESNLREIRRLNRQLTKEGWFDYLREQKPVRGVNIQQSQISMDETWDEHLREAAQRRRPVIRQINNQQIIAIPVILRDEVLGAIEVTSAKIVHEQDALEMMKAVAQRLAASLENTRLFEETQQATAQEQRINEIAVQFQAATTVDELLRITVKELTETLGAEQGAIRLGNYQAAGAQSTAPQTAPTTPPDTAPPSSGRAERYSNGGSPGTTNGHSGHVNGGTES